LTVAMLLLAPLASADTYSEFENTACTGQANTADCKQNNVDKGEIKNNADNGNMKLISAGASSLYMGGVLEGVVAMPSFMGDVANICVGSALNLAANLAAFINAKGNGKKIDSELDAIARDAQRLKERLEDEELRRSKEFQIEIFDFYLSSLERLRKISELRQKQHGNNKTYYSIAMAAGIAEAIIYSLPWSSNPPMAKCGAIAAGFAGIALAMESKAQDEAGKLITAYTKRWQVIAEIKARLMMGTDSMAKAHGNFDTDRNLLGGEVVRPGSMN